MTPTLFELNKRIKDRNAAAKQWARAFEVDASGEFDHAGAPGANLIRESAVMTGNSRLSLRTQVVIARQTGRAGHTITGVPAQTDLVAGLDMADLVAHRGDRTHDLMAGNDWIPGKPPVVIDHAQVAVADPAILDINFHLVNP
jgi:hypothetical protein